ncbi:MAG: hypothetical protein HS108_03880 [Planctomycetes bacterium]|jgi:hypothetical protein|nr:hypothetical protein [Planctomycetota bacterium]MCL4729306.1 hypothetical protein [Planctomycetota bacterium]
MKKLAAMLFVLGLVAACESTPNPAAEAAPADQTHAYGKKLYEAKCGTCHELYDPGDFTRTELRRAFKKYAPKSGIKRADRPYVEEYLLANAADAR